MTLTDSQIEFIENNLKLYGIKTNELREDLLDHICTYIETNDSQDFDTLYQKALQKFGGYASFQNLQRETHLQKFAKDLVTLNKLKFTIGCIVIILLVVSLLFNVMHWPYANVMLIGAVLVSAFVILPIHFYSKYKKSVYNLS